MRQRQWNGREAIDIRINHRRIIARIDRSEIAVGGDSQGVPINYSRGVIGGKGREASWCRESRDVADTWVELNTSRFGSVSRMTEFRLARMEGIILETCT